MSRLLISAIKGLYSSVKYLSQFRMLRKDVGASFATRRQKEKLFSNRHKGILIDGKYRRLTEKSSFQNMAVYSPPGGGKTTGFIVPNILDRAKFDCSMLITDPSGEIFDNTSQHLHKKGFRILVIDPLNLETSMRFNPFHGYDHRHVIEIEKLCRALVLSQFSGDKDPIWNLGAIAIIEVLAKCIAYSDPDSLTLPNLNHLLQLFGENGEQLDRWVSRSSVNPFITEDRSVLLAWVGIRKSNDDMIASFITIARTALKNFSNYRIQELFIRNEIDLVAFRQEKTAIYIKLSESYGSYFQFIIDIFYTTFFSAMMEGKPNSKKLNVYCYLDEFGNSHVDNFETTITNTRKYRVSICMVFQGTGQLEQKYGKEKANAIRAGIGNSIIYGGVDNLTALEFSKKIGNTVFKQKRSFVEAEIHFSSTSLMPPDMIRVMEEGEGLLIATNWSAAKFNYTPFYRIGSPYRKASKQGAFTQEVRSEYSDFEPIDITIKDE